MEKIEHNLEKELKLINLLGYHIVGPDNSNRWKIYDDEEEVGYIQYKKLKDKNAKKGCQAIYGYETSINSKTISCYFKRDLNDNNGEIIDDYVFDYNIDVKREGEDYDKLSLTLGAYPGLDLSSDTYGYISFDINYKGLYLSYQSQTDNFNVEEIVIYENTDTQYRDNKQYTYQITYCKKDLSLSDNLNMGRITKELTGIESYYDDKLKIEERTWRGGKIYKNSESIVEGTVEEMAIKHKLGIETLNHFRVYINQILPFKEDVFDAMMNKTLVNTLNLNIFFPEYNKSKELTK